MVCLKQLLRQSFFVMILATHLLLPCAVVLAFAPSRRATMMRRTMKLFPPPIFSTAATTSEEGAGGLTKKTISQAGNGQPVKLGDIATVKYTCYTDAAADNDSSSSLLIAKSPNQKMVVGDINNSLMIPGFDQAVRSMQIGERSVVRIPSELAYGAVGLPPVVPENADLTMDLEILDAVPATANIDFDALATADTTPRTAADIAAAYSARQAAAAANSEPPLEGIEAWWAKAQNFYFYGLFEGETGERPPWFLRPSITFPLAFVIVGAAFYISYMSGAITERGAQVTDELDELVVTSVTITLSSSSTGGIDLFL